MQAKLLRVLQEQEFERVGGSKTVKVNVRVIATTNLNLEESVEKGELRQDLYFRLNVVPIYVPPLRERTGDVLFLAEKFRKLFVRKHGMEANEFSEDSFNCLKHHDFPGNVRELQNVVERAVIRCNPDGVITPEQLNLASKSLSPSIKSGGKPIHSTKAESFQKLEDAEKEHIIRALAKAGQHRTKAAKLLGVNIRTLRNKIAAYKKDAKTDEDLGKPGLDPE